MGEISLIFNTNTCPNSTNSSAYVYNYAGRRGEAVCHGIVGMGPLSLNQNPTLLDSGLARIRAELRCLGVPAFQRALRATNKR